MFEKIGEKEEQKGEGDASQKETLVWDCRVQLSRLAGIADVCDRFRTEEAGRNDIFWLEACGAPGPEDRCGSSITPLDIGPLMREAVFEPIKTVLFTSATLTVCGQLLFLGRADRPGRPCGAGADLPTFPSPFNYREHVLLGVPTDAPAPDSPRHKGSWPGSSRKRSWQATGRGWCSSPRTACCGTSMRRRSRRLTRRHTRHETGR